MAAEGSAHDEEIIFYMIIGSQSSLNHVMSNIEKMEVI